MKKDKETEMLEKLDRVDAAIKNMEQRLAEAREVFALMRREMGLSRQ